MQHLGKGCAPMKNAQFDALFRCGEGITTTNLGCAECDRVFFVPKGEMADFCPFCGVRVGSHVFYGDDLPLMPADEN